MSGKSHVRLQICGGHYNIVSEDDESYIRQVGGMVEQRIQKFLERNPSVSVSAASVFAALEFCDEAEKSRRSADNLRNQIKAYLEEVKQVRAENDELRRRVPPRNK